MQLYVPMALHSTWVPLFCCTPTIPGPKVDHSCWKTLLKIEKSNIWATCTLSIPVHLDCIHFCHNATSKMTNQFQCNSMCLWPYIPLECTLFVVPLADPKFDYWCSKNQFKTEKSSIWATCTLSIPVHLDCIHFLPQIKWPTNANPTLCAYGLTFHLSASYLLRPYQALKLTIDAEKPY